MKKLIATSAAIVLAVTLAGCSTGGSPASKPADKPAASEPSFAPEPTVEAPEPPAASGPIVVKLGEAVTYEDGVSISVSTPVEYIPTQYAAGSDQPVNVVFTITITNGTAGAIEPFAYGQVTSGGISGSQIFDSGGPVEIGNGPSAAILAGQAFSWNEAWSIADLATLQYQVSPGFEYEDAIFTQ